LLELNRAPIPYVGASLVVNKSTAHRNAPIYEAMLKGTLDALRFFQKPGNKPTILKIIAKNLRLSRVTDAETAYNAMLAAYSNDLVPKAEGIKKIYAILTRTNPKLLTLKPESILDESFIQKIHASGY